MYRTVHFNTHRAPGGPVAQGLGLSLQLQPALELTRGNHAGLAGQAFHLPSANVAQF